MTNRADVECLIGELKDVIANAQHLLHKTADTIEEGAAVARTRVQQSVHHAGRRLRSSRRDIVHRGRIAALVTDRYVHQRPWKAIGIAAGIAFAIGCAIARRNDD